MNRKLAVSSLSALLFLLVATQAPADDPCTLIEQSRLQSRLPKRLHGAALRLTVLYIVLNDFRPGQSPLQPDIVEIAGYVSSQASSFKVDFNTKSLVLENLPEASDYKIVIYRGQEICAITNIPVSKGKLTSVLIRNPDARRFVIDRSGHAAYLFDDEPIMPIQRELQISYPKVGVVASGL